MNTSEPRRGRHQEAGPPHEQRALAQSDLPDKRFLENVVKSFGQKYFP